MTQIVISTEVLDQFKQVFFKFREVIASFPEQEWCIGESKYQRPAGLACHFLATVDFYTSGLSADEFPWGHRLGCDWEDPDDLSLPSKAMVIDYMEEMETRLEAWTVSTDFLAEERLHPYCGKTILGRAVYLIRHCESHLAELNLELRRRGFLGPEWR